MFPLRLSRLLSLQNLSAKAVIPLPLPAFILHLLFHFVLTATCEGSALAPTPSRGVSVVGVPAEANLSGFFSVHIFIGEGCVFAPSLSVYCFLLYTVLFFLVVNMVGDHSCSACRLRMAKICVPHALASGI